MDIALGAKEIFIEQFPAVAEAMVDLTPLINKNILEFILWLPTLLLTKLLVNKKR